MYEYHPMIIAIDKGSPARKPFLECSLNYDSILIPIVMGGQAGYLKTIFPHQTTMFDCTICLSILSKTMARHVHNEKLELGCKIVAL